MPGGTKIGNIGLLLIVTEVRYGFIYILDSVVQKRKVCIGRFKRKLVALKCYHFNAKTVYGRCRVPVVETRILRQLSTTSS